jgi:hypothetical protein
LKLERENDKKGE